MATRSKIVFCENNKPFTAIYRHWDGYPSGAGVEIAKFLKPFTVVNGYGSDALLGQIANGMGCLAAQFVALFKTAVGNYYIVEPSLGANSGEEFVYIVDNSKSGITLTVVDVWENKRTKFTDMEHAVSVMSKMD